MARFNPKKHLISLKGKMYLETKFRIQWFREEHPRGCISTEIVSYDPMMVKATVYDGEGAVLATAHAGAVDKGNAVWSGRSLEKSETAAIGRALAHAGYGTQFAGDEDGGGIGRAAVETTRPAPTARTPAADEDLRDKENASRFIQRWRKESLSDADVLGALGVSKLSEWTRGRQAADQTVNTWLSSRVVEKVS